MRKTVNYIYINIYSAFCRDSQYNLFYINVKIILEDLFML